MTPTPLAAVGALASSLPAAANFASVLAQIPDPIIETPEEAALVFSGPHFFIALVAGIVLAFAFQFLLTNLGVAAGISLAGGSSDSDSGSSSSDDADSMGETISKIGFAVGITTLITVVISLFCATWLAVRLSLLTLPGMGAIVGLVIWAAYFSLLLWISSTTVGSLIGSVVNTATSGVQSIFGAATSVFQTNLNDGMVATAEAAAAAVRRELTSSVDSDQVQEQLEDYLTSLRSPELDMAGLRAEFESMIDESGIAQSTEGEALPQLERSDFIKLVDDRTDLSNRDRDRIADQLYAVWNRRASRYRGQQSSSRLSDYLQQATADQLTGSEFKQKLDQLIGAVQNDGSRQQSGQQSGQRSGNSGLKTAMTQTVSSTLNSMMGIVMGRTDLSDIDVESVVSQLKSAQSQAAEQVGAVASNDDTYNTIREDAKAYLFNTYHWRMSTDRMAREFRDIIYDPNADPSTVSYQLDHISRSDFADWLGERGVFTQGEIKKRADVLESIRIEALSAAAAAMEREQVIDLLAEVEAYLLKTPTDDLTPEKIQLSFKPILRDSDASDAQLSARLSRLDRTYFDRVLTQRKDVTETEIGFIVMQLEKARNEVLEEAANTQKAVQSKATDQWDRIKAFLRETDRHELNPDALERELSVLLDDPQAGLAALKTRASQFNRDTLVQVLNQRQDLSEDEINLTIDQVERRWQRIRYAPKQLMGEAQAQYDQAMSALTDYLRRTDRDELNPKGIRQDLQLLFDNPELGLKAFRARLSEVDRGTLVALLAQRKDLSEAEANRIINDVTVTLRDIARAPRRIARRTQLQVQDFQTTVEEYLRSTQKEELNPEGIKRDVTLLLNEPQAGMSSLGDRLAHFDRTTVAALLAQREDMTREEADQVVDQVMSVKDELAYQVQLIQERIGSMVNRLLAQVRSYLDSLDRPELEYDGVKRDVRTLFDDPNAGFDALRARLGRFNRDTLVAIASSNDRISEADANRVIDQVERARNSVLQQAEYVQREAQLKLEQVKRRAAYQAEETRKAAAAASWWLFLTGLLSAIASACAGALGVMS